MEFQDRVYEEQAEFKRLLSRIPGFGGYLDREMRRDADKLLRTYVADRLTEQRDRLSEVEVQLAGAGQLTSLPAVDLAFTKLQLLIDHLRIASYGYAGWFDALEVREAELDRLYRFDAGLLAGVDEVVKKVDALVEKVANREPLEGAAGDLAVKVEDLNRLFGQRQEIVSGR
ncbi:MAG: hypothetical protein M1136_01490 [Chloroflexi bacterium]|nr:hypothetical protein [Chloroflexota bacterium]MCL5074313.1 hypothetical protein [Chloroflexota bacterium]